MAGAKLRQCSDCLEKGKKPAENVGTCSKPPQQPFSFFFPFFFSSLLSTLGRIFIVCQHRLWFSGFRAIGEGERTQKSCVV